MKAVPAIGLSAVFFVGGLFVGQRFLPSNDATVPMKDGPTSSRKVAQKSGGGVIGAKMATSSATGSSPAVTGDIEGLLALVDPIDPFATSLKLRELLGPMQPGDLIELLNGLTEDLQKDPSFYMLRQSAFNHLVMADPFAAFDLAANHPEKNFQQLFLGIALRGVAQKDLGRARAMLADITNPQLKNNGFSMIAQVAMDSNPSAMMEILGEVDENGFPSPYYPIWDWKNHHHGGLPSVIMTNSNQLLMQWAAKDPDAVEAYARSIDDPQKRATAMSSLVYGIAQRDPERALALAGSIENLNSRSQAMSGAILGFANGNPARAAGMLDQIKNVQTRNQTIGSLASQWMRKDQTAALAWLDSLPPGPGRTQGYGSAISQLTLEDPSRAASLFTKLPTAARRNSIQHLVYQWAAQDFEAARDWVINLDDPVSRTNATSQLVNSWINKDPAGAAAYLTDPETPKTNQSNHSISQVAAQWAQKDPAAAMAWAESLENDSLRKNAISGLYRQWSSSDPAAAAAKLASVTDPQDRKNAMHAIAEAWTNSDPDAAISWLETLPTEDRYPTAVTTLSALSYTMPERAAALFTQLSQEVEGDQELETSITNQVGTITTYWSQYDPQSAAAWAAELPEGKSRDNAVSSVAANWVGVDPIGAAGWIDTLPAGDSRDSATANLVAHVRQTDPTSAFDWAETISDDQKRLRSIQNVVNHWKSEDPEAARAAVIRADLSETEREQLLGGIE